MSEHERLQSYNKCNRMACFTGLLGCRWHRYQQSTLPATKCDVLWFWILNAACVYMLFWFYYWILSGNSMDSINGYAYSSFGTFVPMYAIMFILTCIALGYVFLVFVLAILHIAFGHQVYIHWSHRILLCVVLALASATTIVMDQVWSDGWRLQNVSIMITAPFLQVSIVALITLLSWFILSWLIPSRNEQMSIHHNTAVSVMLRVLLSLLYVAMMCFLYLIPLAIQSPCISNHIPTKPRLVAHKGASALAPENSVVAFQYATKYNVLVLESDVSVSYDGVPFILHDTTFKRTSNVGEVFPGSEDKPACLFNIADILKLDAGSWFLRDKPYGSVGHLTEAERALFSNQTVATLAQLLEVARDSGTAVMFDIKLMDDIRRGHCAGHPYQHNFTDVIMDVAAAVGLPDEQMWWLYYNRLNFTTDNGLISNKFNYTPVSADTSIPPADLAQSGVNIVNFAYHAVTEESVSDYNEHNVSVNLWTIDSLWLFSLNWCMGAGSITTNRCHELHALSAPVWHLTEDQYLLMWLLTDVISLLIILSMTVALVILRRRAQRESETISMSDSCRCTHMSYTTDTIKSKLLASPAPMSTSSDELCNIGTISDSPGQLYDRSVTVGVDTSPDFIDVFNQPEAENYGKLEIMKP